MPIGIANELTHVTVAFGIGLKSQFILLFNLFLLLFMGLSAFFGIIYGFYYTISVNFYFYLLYF